MPENNSEFSYSTPETPSPKTTYDDVEEPVDAELEAFVPEADKILEEARGLNLEGEAQRIRQMEALFETIDDPNRLVRRKEDVKHLRGVLTGASV
jgi:hypothetical protein